jgi:Histidine kinase/Y_Y_Y domain
MMKKKIISAEKVSNSALNPKGLAGQQIIYANEKDDLLFFSMKTGKFLYKIHSNKPTYSLIDKEGNVWVGTLGHGVFRYPSLAFNHQGFNSNVPEIFSIEKVKNQIVAGSNFSKLYSITQNNFKNTDYSANLTISGNFPAKTSRQNRVYKLLYSDNNLYIGTDAFIIKKEVSGKEIVKNIYPVKDLWLEGNTLIVCLSTGVLLLNADDLSVKDTILRQRATAGIIYNNNYIIGTIGGLVKIDPATKKITRLNRLHPSLEKRITAIKKGRDNDLWIATSGGGIIQFRNDKVIRTITAYDGLTGDICSGLFIDSDEIWVATNKGINKIVFIKDSFNITQFTTADGLASNTINAIYADSSKVYVGSSAGLTYFDKSFTEGKPSCKLDILEAGADGKKINIDSSYTFPYNVLNIRFDFIAISFKSAGDVKYYYRLEGLDDRWNLTGNTYINFATLPPGTYKLQIKAKNKFGIESPVKSIHITITPPWWKTWWFLSLVFAGSAAAIIFLYKRRINKIKKEEEAKRMTEVQFAALEQQALQAQMNPHFIFNCLNSIQSFIIANDVYGANKYLSGFAGLIRQTLDHSSLSAISIAEEIKYLGTYLELERMRFKNKFTYTITNDSTDITNINIPAMIVQPFVENAIRHGIQHRTDNEGKIAVHFKKDHENNLYCTVTDNGVGRKKVSELKSKQHIEYQSKGTVITQKRINIINDQHKTNITILSEDVTADDNSIAGTKVTIYFPASFIKKTTYD